ncbi:hypothetical protein OPV22_020757 [Ensete ventricosum]|uniref:Transcriptional coactivator p15 (PC4) C-terminal domain-containing protein n=1 Tax=Ensete ventricosum TaxID=4639 RepID=A0AAV8QH61_ENSVE|nr:hypothetical protein OPV22_020757 [Ensete ventricosum]
MSVWVPCGSQIRSIHEKGSKLWTARTTGKGVPYQALSTKASNREIIAFSLVGEVGTHSPTGGKRIPRHAKKRVQTPLLLFASDIDANGEAMKRERRPDETDSDDERGVLPEKKAAVDGESGGDANEIIICKMSNKRRVTVRKWKAVAVVDVRELYFKKGKPHPGKKGTSLPADQVLVTTLLWCGRHYANVLKISTRVSLKLRRPNPPSTSNKTAKQL